MPKNISPLKARKIKSKGWKIGTASDFLGLSKKESEFVQMKLDLARFLKGKRLRKNFSQIELAKHINSSQSRIAKMERGDPSVSMDLLIHSLLTLGTTRKELARAIDTSPSR